MKLLKLFKSDFFPVMVRKKGSGLHPLLIPEVVENVFEFCSFKDLTSCRLVSKVWHDNSLKRWRSLAKVRIVGGDRSRMMTKFLKFVKNEKKKPGSFKPYSGHFVVLMPKNLDPLLKEFRLHITALELKDVTFKNVGDLRKVIFQSCPNMKELTLLNPIRVSNALQNISEPTEWMEPQFGENLNLRRLTLSRRTKSFGITRMEILSHFPGVEELIQKEPSFQAGNRVNADDDKLFNVVGMIKNHDPTKLKLKSIEDLEIVQPVSNRMYSVPHSLLTLLLMDSLEISLEHLAVVLGGSVDDAQFALRYVILLGQHETLKKLELLRTPTGPYLSPFFVFRPVNFTHLNNLQELTLRSRVFGSLHFLASMRNLKKLTIYGWEDGYLDNIVKGTCHDDIPMESLVLDKCTELNLAFHLDKEDLERIVGIFPNVEKVTISLDNEMLAVVCKNWRKLVELNVYNSSLDDVGMSGLGDEKVSSANDKGSLGGRGEARERKPNISWLRHLRRVSISNWEQFQVTRSLGHASTTFGFCRVPYLEYLQITNYNVKEDVKKAFHACATSCVFTRVQRDHGTWLEDLKKSLF